MGFGVLEDYKLEHVPGTAPLADLHDQTTAHGIDASRLKHDKTGNIVLVPQPSDDPNDPYNWPQWKKGMMTACWAIGTGYVGALGPLITSATVPLSVQFDCTISEFISGTNGGLLVAIGLFAIISNATSVVIGKRPIYFLGNLLCAVSCFWCAYAKNLTSLTAARVIQGFGIAPMETLVGPTISDYHHVHTRGQMIALFNFGVLGGINLASPIAGVILDKAGIKTCFNAAGGFGIFLLVLCFFFMPESSFHRSSALSIDSGSTDNLHQAVEVEAREKETTLATQVSNVDETVAHQGLGKRQPFLKDLRIFSYRGHDSALVVALRPLRMVGSPIVLWACLMYCLNLTWAVGIAVTLSQIFSAPPYNFTVTQVGLCNMSSFVFTALALPLATPLSDSLSKYCARRNKGIYEPEFRLLVIGLGMCFSVVGFVVYGASIQQQMHWAVTVVVGLGLQNFGLQLVGSTVVTYVVDCYRDKAAEAIAVPKIVQCLFTFGFTYYVNGWLASSGPGPFFYTIAGLVAGSNLTTIPMYIYGKRVRSYIHRHNIVK